MNYVGIHIVKMDSKGRFSIPAAFRPNKEGEFRFLEHPESPVLIGHLESGLSKNMRSLSTIFSREVQYKEGGRSVLPKEFRDYIEIPDHETQIAAIGMGNHFQLWSLDNWKKVEPAYKARLMKAMMAESVWVPPSSDMTS